MVDPPQNKGRDKSGRYVKGAQPTRGFTPGKSGNPGGLPKTVKEIRTLALSHSPAALERLVELVESADEHVAVRAAEAILDRAGIRPFNTEPEKIEVVGDTGDAVQRLALALNRRLEAAGASSSAPELPQPG